MKDLWAERDEYFNNLFKTFPWMEAVHKKITDTFPKMPDDYKTPIKENDEKGD